MTTPHVWSRIGRWPTVVGLCAKYAAIGTGKRTAPVSFCWERPLTGHEQRVWVTRDV